MVTVERYRAIVLSMPDAVESAHMGHPDFRVGGKIFATLWPDKRRAVLRLERELTLALVEERPDTFDAAWGATGMVGVDLDGIEEPELRELVERAWRHRLPEKKAPSAKAASQRRKK